MKRACVMLLAYNEELAIGPLIEKIHALHFPGIDITALVIDDGSKDKTADVARSKRASVISHKVNKGVGAAFRSGLEWALSGDFDFLVHMDGDGQLLPEDTGLLLRPVVEGKADLAIASRFLTGSPPNLARWKATLLRAVARLVGFFGGSTLTDLSCGFRCMNRMVMQSLKPNFDYDYIQQTLIQAMGANARIIEITVTVIYPETAGKETAMSANVFRYGSRFLLLVAYSITGLYKNKVKRLLRIS